MGRKKLHQPDQVLEVIQRWIAREGHAPSIEELRQELELGSSRTVLQYLDELESAGSIRRTPGARGIKILRRPNFGEETRPVPLIGQVPAGALALAEEVQNGWLNMPVEELKPKSARFFLLRVYGSSMNRALVENELIEDGDLVLVRQQMTAESGEVVVAYVDGEATVKRLSRLPNYVVLKPESTDSNYKPILVGPGFRVQGVVTKVIKRGAELFGSEVEN